MPLINLKTNLKSLKFGRDRPGGGSSNQPYIKSKIPNQDSDQSSILNTGGLDSLLRGGLLAPVRAAEDTSRLTQMFADTKSSTGILFTAKQNVLSRLSAHTEASFGIGYGAGKLNQGIYTPASTIGQAAAGFTGTHLNAFGLNPLQPLGTGGLDTPRRQSLQTGLRRYENIVRYNNLEVDKKEEKANLASARDIAGSIGGLKGLFTGAIVGGVNYLKGGGDETSNKSTVGNRLENYLDKYINGKTDATHFPSTTGGPGSLLGIGRTSISLASLNQRTGVNNLRNDSGGLYFAGYNKNIRPDTTSKLNSLPLNALRPFSKNFNGSGNDTIEIEGNDTWENLKADTVYELDNLGNGLADKSNTLGAITWKQEDFIGQDKSDLFRTTGKITDFRNKLTASPDKKVLGKLTNGYTEKIQMITRVKIGDPGKSKNVEKYGAKYGLGETLDKITASPILQNRNTPAHKVYNDLCKFSIGIVNNDNTGTSNYMHFRAFIDNFSDNYTADWGETQFVGRADKFYNYKGFGRSIDLSFTVAAQSKSELIPMYKKLNYLASSLAPSYSTGGFMQGNLVRLTVGGYLYNQVGILKAITYTIPQESPWEIGLSDGSGDDNNVKELPHMIKVTGFQFTPIQDFVPQVSDPSGQFNTRFISLDSGDHISYKQPKKKASIPNTDQDPKQNTGDPPYTIYGSADTSTDQSFQPIDLSQQLETSYNAVSDFATDNFINDSFRSVNKTLGVGDKDGNIITVPSLNTLKIAMTENVVNKWFVGKFGTFFNVGKIKK